MSAAALRLLLVEDSADDAALILLQLELAAIWPRIVHRRVETAAALRTALAEESWDVVISDYNLPRFGAEGVLAELAGHDAGLPVIVVSGFVGEESAAAVIKAGADDFVMKGNLGRLAPVIQRALRDAATRREHHAAQAALQRSEKRLRAITDAMPEAVFVVDPRGRLRWMNPEAERLLGWREEDLIDRAVHDVIHRAAADAPPSPPDLCCSLRALRDGHTHRNDDDTFLHKSGAPVPVSYVATPLVEDGRVVGVVTAIRNIAAQKQARLDLLEARQRSQTLAAHLQSAREQERTRIARELHDQLGQMLTALKIDVTWLREHLPREDAPSQDKIAGMKRLIDDTLQWVRRMSSELRPVMLDDLGLGAAIEWLLEEFASRHGIACRLEGADDDIDLADDCATAAFRIVQEALTNVARHAGARALHVRLAQRDDRLAIRIADDGRGFDPEQPRARSSFGLIGIRERAEMLGGCCTLRSAPGQGTTLDIELPLHPTRCEDKPCSPA